MSAFGCGHGTKTENFQGRKQTIPFIYLTASRQIFMVILPRSAEYKDGLYEWIAPIE